MKSITITGEDQHIDNIVKENRVRESRGYISIERAEGKEISFDEKRTLKPDTKKVKPDTKKPKK